MISEARLGGDSSLVKRGDEIFTGDAADYPRTWDGLVGQVAAKNHLQTVIESAIARKAPIDHTLIQSGMPGVGKTTIAQIMAYSAECGLLMVSGALTVDDARDLLNQCEDRDILFWDEFHLAVAGNKNRADWLLPFMTDGVLVTKRGREPVPRVGLIAATTEAGKLLPTLVGRFVNQPLLVPYTVEEATLIVQMLAQRLKYRVSRSEDWIPIDIASKIAVAADLNPRMAKRILSTLRDMTLARERFALDVALDRVGVTRDGLTRDQQGILLALGTAKNLTLSERTIQAVLGEPGSLKYAEHSLIQRGYVEIGGQGRTLTDEGHKRAKELIKERKQA